jgi:UDP-N-acetylmuramate dehydrogenase
VGDGEFPLYDLADSLSHIPGIHTERNVPLSRLTRFGIGGPAALLVDTVTEAALEDAIAAIRLHDVPLEVIGGGTNLVVADGGFDGAVVRYRGDSIAGRDGTITAGAGAELQALVDHAIDRGLAGLHTMTRIPGWVGAAVYGNAGAYGHSIHEFVTAVRYFDGCAVQCVDNAGCRFRYRESIFKGRKDWVILSADLKLPPGDPLQLRREADSIRAIRDAKYPPEMRCAGSIFKNLLLAELPPEVAARVPPAVIREGKVPSAWFLEQAGAKGMRRGDIQVAHYHANLVYNDGRGTAADLRWVIEELKARVRDAFGLALEEEVQFVGL